MSPSSQNGFVPYKGLTPYDEDDADFFFGRQKASEIISANLVAARLTLLYGASGVGKSSVLRAGVVHRLKAEASRNLMRTGLPESAVLVFRAWRDNPLDGLKNELQQAVAAAIDLKLTQPRKRAPLVDTISTASEQVGGDLLIILDQFEEYFLYHPQDTGEGSFAFELARAVNQRDLRVNFLISIREDALAQLDKFKGRIPNLFDNYMRIQHLDLDAARDAVVKPLEHYNELHATNKKIGIEPKLVDAVLQQVRTGLVVLGEAGRGAVEVDSGATGEAQIETPYLQLVMTRLWQEEIAGGSTKLRLATLQRLGGAESIIRTHLDAAMRGLPQTQQDQAARIFNQLVTPSGTKIAHTASDLAKYANLKEAQLAPVLEKLSESELRILRPVAPPPDQPKASRYEIFHDVLAPAVLDWRARFVREQEKAEAKRQAALEAEARAKEAARERELEQAQALADEQRKRAEEQSKAAKRLRRRAVWLVILLGAVAVLAVIAIQKWNAAVIDRKAAVEARAQAEHDRESAVRAADLAERERLKAEIAAVQAEIEEKRAEMARVFADLEKRRAEDEARKARQAQAKEKKARELADLLSQISLAGNLVNLAPLQQLTGEPETGVKLAHLAFEMNRANLDSLRQPKYATLRRRFMRQLFNGEYDALRRSLNALPGKPGGPLARNFSHWVQALAYDSETGLLAVGTADGSLALINNTDIVDVKKAHNGSVRSLAFHPTEPKLVSASDDSTIQLWTVDSGKLDFVRQIPGDSAQTARVLAVTFAPDGKRLFSCGTDSVIHVWDAEKNYAPLSPLAGHGASLRTLAVSPDGKMLVSGGADKKALVWQAGSNTFKPVRELKHNSPVRIAKFNPGDSNILATGSQNGIVRIWDVASENSTPSQTLLGHEKAVNSLAFSPDGELLASGSSDETVRIWHLNVPERAPDLLRGEHGETVWSVAFDASGSHLASGSSDKTVRIWQARTQALAQISVDKLSGDIELSPQQKLKFGIEAVTASDTSRAKIE